jgi:diguanylate cyclase (GGDEF)-like protein
MDSVDAVTHLHNMYAFLRAMREPAAKRNANLVMMIGINQFQSINDMYDYQVGNMVLRSMALALTDFMHGHKRVYRLDGAKFALCFQNVDREQAVGIYAQLQELARTQIQANGKHIPLSISGGAVFLGDKSAGEFSVRACLAYAQECSKREHHSALVFFNSEEKHNDMRSLELIEAVRESVFDGCKGFFLCYQPLVRSKDNAVIGMEALVRWQQESYGVVAPNRFIPWLEQDDCFFELGSWILRQAMMDAKKIVAKRPDFIVNVNISYTQLARECFTETLVSLLKQTGFPAKNLCLELTERCRALDEDKLCQMLTEFRSHGIRIALDDFGTGTAALTLLRKLPITSLKLDRTFIADIQSNETTGVLVNHIIGLAKQLGMGVCLEGIEDKPLRDYVQQYNPSYLQGYYYSKPVQFEKFIELLPRGGVAC